MMKKKNFLKYSLSRKQGRYRMTIQFVLKTKSSNSTETKENDHSSTNRSQLQSRNALMELYTSVTKTNSMFSRKRSQNINCSENPVFFHFLQLSEKMNNKYKKQSNNVNRKYKSRLTNRNSSEKSDDLS